MSGGILLITFSKFSGYDKMSERSREGSETLMAFEECLKLQFIGYIVRNPVQEAPIRNYRDVI